MERVRQAGVAALVLCSLVAPAVTGVVGAPDAPVQPNAAVTWPQSTLVVSEVVTGGASASDEFVELANQGPATVDLAGLEVVYVTASGSTVSRKAVWTEVQPLASGQRLLIGNAAGSFLAQSDLSYSGGFAATGGAVVLRAVGGAPIDAVGWGDATNAFVEGTAAPAPPAGSSLERRPGGPAGNGHDSNENASDFLVAAVPSPQALASPPVPAPLPSASPSGTASPAPTSTAAPTVAPTPPSSPQASQPTASPTVAPTSAPPTPTPTPAPTSTPPPAPTLAPTPTAAPTPTPEPTATPTPTGTATPTAVPTPTATPTTAPSLTPAPSPTPSPSAVVLPVADARALADGSEATIAGVLTTRLDAFEDGRGAFLQDDTGGIALYLDAVPTTSLVAGTTVAVSGTVDSRFGQRTLRTSETEVVPTGTAQLPVAIQRPTGLVGEGDEGRRVEITGTTTGSASTLSDGVAVWVDDGTGPARVIVAPDVLGTTTLASGTRIRAAGPVGQRDSSGTGSGGYRVHVTETADFDVVPEPEPSPSPTASPTATPSPAPSPTPSATPSLTPAPTASPSGTPRPTTAPTATPAPTPAPVTEIADARRLGVGARVQVEGIVTAEPGRAGGPTLIAVQDATGGIIVKLGDGSAGAQRGARLRVTGVLHAPYGQLELRPVRDGARVTGSGPIPSPALIAGADLGEAVEGRLVSVEGVVDGRPRRVSGGDTSLTLVASDGTRLRVLADASSGIEPAAIADDARYRLTGIAGQRASRKDALDGYRIWLRDRADIRSLSSSVGSPTPSSGTGAGGSGGASPSGEGGSALISISAALRQGEGDVRVRATVTAGASLLDASGRRIVVEDPTAGIEVLLPAGSSGPAAGTTVEVEGTLGRAYGAPRIRAEAVTAIGSGAARSPLVLAGPPGPAHEWRLVRVSGSVVDVRRLGSRWRAELETPGGRVPISGLSGAAIPATTLVEGRPATIVGIARRAHPTATDRRYAVVPRGTGDVSVGPADAAAGSGSGTPAARSPGSRGQGMRPDPDTTLAPGVVDADLADLASHAGRTVRVGGIVADLLPDGFRLDDGTATATVVLTGAATEYLPLIEPEDALNVVGRVEIRDDIPVVVVEDPAGILRVGDLPANFAETPTPTPDAGSRDLVRPVTADATGPLGLGTTGIAGLGSLVLISFASVAVTLLRRRRMRQLLFARIGRRLEAVAAGARDVGGATDAPGVPRGGTSVRS